MKKVLIVGGSYYRSYYRPFAPWGEYTGDRSLLYKEPEKISLVVFCGGEDVTPSLYGEPKNKRTYNNPKRDEFELEIFDKAKELKLPLAGICRGSQFLCVMAGGKLVQHINGHGRSHHVKTDDNRTIWVSSTHHQMQLPPKDAVALAWAEPALSGVYEDGSHKNLDPEKEHDCVWYPNINALGMQYHPEYLSPSEEGFIYSQELVSRFFGEPPK